jgi:hypothetical protein
MRVLRFIPLFFLTACVGTALQPIGVVHKTGSTSAERRAVFDACDFESLQAVPRAMTVETTPGSSAPGQTYCNAVGRQLICNQVGGYNIPSRSYSVDANQEYRNRYLERCLAQRGYGSLFLPKCTTASSKKYIFDNLDRQPPASEIACWIEGQA